MGCRRIDKLDLFLFPIVLFLRLSLSLFVLLPSATRLICILYNYGFNQGSPLGFQLEVTQSLSYLYYIIFCVAMLTLFWLHHLVGWSLLPVFYLWMAVAFWPRFFWCLFKPDMGGCSVWTILADPEDFLTTQQMLKYSCPAGSICPVWPRYMVFSTYQVYGAYAHLYQHWNQDVAESLTESAGPTLPSAWDPL